MTWGHLCKIAPPSNISEALQNLMHLKVPKLFGIVCDTHGFQDDIQTGNCK